MAKTKSVAKSKVSTLKSSVNRKIEDFTGSHSGIDITPKLLGEEPIHIVKECTDAIDSTLIEETTMPVTKIPDDNRDALQKKIDTIVNGKTQNNNPKQ